MLRKKDGFTKKKFCCWINEDDRIISFHFVEGYILKEFKTYKEFQEYSYQKSYWGYLVQ